MFFSHKKIKADIEDLSSQVDALAYALGFVRVGGEYFRKAGEPQMHRLKVKEESVPVKKKDGRRGGWSTARREAYLRRQHLFATALPEAPVEIVKKLRDLRLAKGWDQRLMGKKLGISHSSYNYTENGMRGLPMKAVKRAYELLGEAIPATRTKPGPKPGSRHTAYSTKRRSFHHLPHDFYNRVAALEVGQVLDVTHDAEVAHLSVSKLKARIKHNVLYGLTKILAGRDHHVFHESADGTIRVKRLA